MSCLIDGTVTNGRKPTYAEIDTADSLIFTGLNSVLDCHGNFHRNGGKPSVGFARNRNGYLFTGKAQLLAHLDDTDNWQLKTPSDHGEGARAVVCSETVVLAFALGLWVLGFTRKKARECSPEIFNSLLRCHLSDLKHPRELLAFNPVKPFAKAGFAHFFTGLITLLPLLQCPVPCEPSIASTTGAVDALLDFELQSNLMSNNQGSASAAAVAALWARRLAPRRPYNRAQKLVRISIMS